MQLCHASRGVWLPTRSHFGGPVVATKIASMGAPLLHWLSQPVGHDAVPVRVVVVGHDMS